MAVTAQRIITDALRLIGVVAAGETPDPSEVNDGLVALNDYIDELKTERLTIYITERHVYPLTMGQKEYTIGPGGDLDQQRPLWLPYAGLIINNTATPSTEIGIDVYSIQQYADIYQKDLQSGLVQCVYYDHGWDSGLGKIFVYPIPNQPNTSLVLYTPRSINEFADLTTEYTFPPGYRKMLKYNLAVQLAAEYAREVPAPVLANAFSSKANVKAANATQPGLMRVDYAMVGRARSWNWRTGTDNTRGSGQ